MTKLHYQRSQASLIEACAGELTQFFFSGERIKSAASDVFSRAKLAEFAPPKGKFGIHCVIVGSQEHYGPNRNGDGFPSEALQKYGSTFVSHGHMFREHRNRHPDLKIGDIKAAAYHPKLHRTELIMWGDCEKAAAEYADARKGKQRSYSMSCRVPYDICSICSKKAATTENYCDDLKYGMLQWDDEQQKFAYAINDKPTFFDSSDVGRPADRIAHGLEYFLDEDMAKAASAEGKVMGGAELARLAGVSLVDGEPLTAELRLCLSKLAGVEDRITWEVQNRKGKDAFSYMVREVLPAAYPGDSCLSADALTKLASLEAETLFYELAKRACVLPFRDFVGYISECKHSTDQPVIKKASAMLPTAFRDMTQRCQAANSVVRGIDMFRASRSKFAAEVDPANTDDVQKVMELMIDKAGIEPQPVKLRAVEGIMGDSASDQSPPDQLNDEEQAKAALWAEMYGAYKLAAYEDIIRLRRDLDPEYVAVVVAATK